MHIFEALAELFSTPEIKLTILTLEPHQDATSGTYTGFGFGGVINWCAANKERLQMLIDFRGASALFLQMDTDIAQQANGACVALGHSARHCCQEKLNQQFGTTQEPPLCYYILPTQNSETWLLASHDFSALDTNFKAIHNYELITDTEQLLITLGFPSKNGGGGGRRILNKHPAKKYVSHAKRLADNLSLARQRCSELNRLCLIMESCSQ